MVETGTGTLPAYTETLPRLPESVSGARRLVCLALSVWGMDGLRDGAEIVTSELVTNAVVRREPLKEARSHEEPVDEHDKRYGGTRGPAAYRDPADHHPRGGGALAGQ
ncbi:hypothetical protein AB0O07_03650 [Streptomyces sp. NPDC093085]|uniref:hypothetical protein n=1 Tax=Streptomyces sp. NPDC093085 TaxID=3155068 RepID=UPI003444B009